MTEIIEMARLIVVKLGGSIPWCLVDPQRWGEEGARGETAMLHALNTSPGNPKSPSLRYTLFGHTVTMTAFHATYTGSPVQAGLRLDDKVSLPVGCRRMENGHRHLFEAHPELRVRIRTNDRKKDYPLVIVPVGTLREGEGLVLVESAGLLPRSMGIEERDLFCQASGIS
ncbi:MAG: hypothetical protein NTW26_11955 [bacterium]|nr:hypothetical protein [bacterium]